jgi:hypothetical protein
MLDWRRIVLLMFAAGFRDLARQCQMSVENEETKCQLPTCGDGRRQV